MPATVVDGPPALVPPSFDPQATAATVVAAITIAVAPRQRRRGR